MMWLRTLDEALKLGRRCFVWNERFSKTTAVLGSWSQAGRRPRFPTCESPAPRALEVDKLRAKA